jgi:hypothetical protein
MDKIENTDFIDHAIIPRMRIIPKAERNKNNLDVSLRKRKYELLESIEFRIPFNISIPLFGHIKIEQGKMILFEGFTWDGASGPAIDTATFIIPSAIHDALYFLIKNNKFDNLQLPSWLNWLLRAVYRKIADILLVSLCAKFGMNMNRAWYVYYAVRIFGGIHMLMTKKGK